MHDQLGHLSSTTSPTPSSNVGLVGDERGGITHSTVDSIHPEPADSLAADGRLVDGSNVSTGVHHTEDEKTENCRHDDDSLEPEEGAQLVWPHSAKWEMHKPEEEER